MAVELSGHGVVWWDWALALFVGEIQFLIDATNVIARRHSPLIRRHVIGLGCCATEALL